MLALLNLYQFYGDDFNGNGVPARGLLIVAGLMTIVLFATMSPILAGQCNRIVDLAVILIVVPYIYPAVAVVKVIYDQQLPRSTFLRYKWMALTAVVYCLWAVIGGDPKTVVYALVALPISVLLYPFFTRSMDAASKRHEAQKVDRASLGAAGAIAVTNLSHVPTQT